MSEIAYYDCDPEQETLSHETIDEAVYDWLDSHVPEFWLATLKVFGWERMTYEFDHERILADALEAADGERADPDGDGTEPTDAMRVAALEFAKVLDREYVSWACERVTDPIVTVNVAEWILENKREWLDDPAVAAFVDKHRGGGA